MQKQHLSTLESHKQSGNSNATGRTTATTPQQQPQQQQQHQQKKQNNTGPATVAICATDVGPLHLGRMRRSCGWEGPGWGTTAGPSSRHGASSLHGAARAARDGRVYSRTAFVAMMILLLEAIGSRALKFWRWRYRF